MLKQNEEGSSVRYDFIENVGEARTQAAKVYGGSLYDLVKEEKPAGQIMEQMNEIRQIFRENPEYLEYWESRQFRRRSG